MVWSLSRRWLEMEPDLALDLGQSLSPPVECSPAGAHLAIANSDLELDSGSGLDSGLGLGLGLDLDLDLDSQSAMVGYSVLAELSMAESVW